MEVGKLILNVRAQQGAHDAVSVKPFGCMPLVGRLRRRAVADHRAATRGAIFCAIETSGDGAVNVYSRVQMYLFKARQAAQKEYTDMLARLGVTEDQVKDFFARHPRFASPLRRSPHAAAGTAGDRLAEVAGYIGKAPWQIRLGEARAAVAQAAAVVKNTPAWFAKLKARLVERGPTLMAQAREEWQVARPLVAEAVKKTARDNLQKARTRFTGRGQAAAPRTAGLVEDLLRHPPDAAGCVGPPLRADRCVLTNDRRRWPPRCAMQTPFALPICLALALAPAPEAPLPGQRSSSPGPRSWPRSSASRRQRRR